MLKSTLEMLGLLVYFHLVLDISVRHRDIRVSSLFLGDNDALCVRQVSDASVLQAIKLILLRETDGLPHLSPFHSQLVISGSLLAGLQSLAKDIAMTRMLKYLQLYHELQYLVVEGNHAILAVLADGRTDKDGLVDNRHILDFNLGQFIWSDKSVILEEASQQKMFVVLIEISLESFPSSHFYRSSF